MADRPWRLLFSRSRNGRSRKFEPFGGVAARLYDSPRLTHDVDIVPRLDATSWQQAVDMLWSNGARPRIPERLDAVRDLSRINQWISARGMPAVTFRSPDGSSVHERAWSAARHLDLPSDPIVPEPPRPPSLGSERLP